MTQSEEINSELEKIFFVDDDVSLLNLVRAKLSKNFRVITFEETNRLIKEAETERPELIIVDLNMPNLDGLEIISMLQNNPLTATIPIACTSASDNQQDRKAAQEMGAIGFISKPYDIKTLSNNIQSLIDNLNKIIVSENKRLTSIISFNSREEKYLIKSKIKELLDRKEKIVLLSWERGSDFNDPEIQAAIDSEKIIFLEMTSSLITKMPYLEDLSPVVEDIENLVGHNLLDYCILFDDPLNLFGLENFERALAISLTLSRLIETNFKESYIFFLHSSDRNKQVLISRLAGIFARLNT